jgi:hypothetical protein
MHLLLLTNELCILLPCAPEAEPMKSAIMAMAVDGPDVTVCNELSQSR